MILAYNGDTIEHEKLIKQFPKIDKTRTGITPATARFLVTNGYDVLLFNYDEGLLDSSFKNKTQDDLALFIEKANSLETSTSARLQWEEIIKFIEAGGMFSTRLATLEDIDSYLKKDTPVRVSIKPNILHSDPKYKDSHAVLVIGKRTDQYLLNDPAPQFTKPYWVQKDRLLESWHAEGALMFVAMKKH